MHIIFLCSSKPYFSFFFLDRSRFRRKTLIRKMGSRWDQRRKWKEEEEMKWNEMYCYNNIGKEESCESQWILAVFEIESGTYTFQYGIVLLFFCDSDIFVCWCLFGLGGWLRLFGLFVYNLAHTRLLVVGLLLIFYFFNI